MSSKVTLSGGMKSAVKMNETLEFCQQTKRVSPELFAEFFCSQHFKTVKAILVTKIKFFTLVAFKAENKGGEENLRVGQDFKEIATRKLRMILIELKIFASNNFTITTHFYNNNILTLAKPSVFCFTI